ncbi:hypothetical protein ACJ73_06990 [Blastomyces percursus]|uniref:Cell wall mannoprotein n=1 Tax=Blastomyces percursus TaxID=1658174 RepID=A0A1J9PZ95_9EURO|nr:hypothetical protein ACJ73_06990 [Blastomyces percursus]
MKIRQFLQALSLASLASARPVPHANAPSRLRVREGPQELSHFKILASVQESLQLNNLNQIQDATFGLLDNEGAAAGAGLIQDPDCLQQATADQAFTNAKAAGDVDGMTHALIYRALERNTGTVGLASALCESIEAVNPEIAAITQHQDPASAGAAEINKQIALDLAVQIASIGGDPLLAIESGTFAPGDVNDATGVGNTCNTEGDEEGCIFTENLLVPDVTEEEINAALEQAGVNVENVAADAADANNVPDQCAAAVAAALEGASASATASTTATTTAAAAATVIETETATASVGTAETALAAATSEAVTAASGGIDQVENTQTLAGQFQNSQFQNSQLQNSQFQNSQLQNSQFQNNQIQATNAISNQGFSSGSSSLSSSSRHSFTSSSRSSLALLSLNLDLGICVGANPFIIFNNGFYSPFDSVFFRHSAVGSIDVLSLFICNTLATTCFASRAVIDACFLGQALAAAQVGLAAADIFNNAFLTLSL